MTISEGLTRDLVARTLAEHLDEATLRRCFPAHEPERIRRILAGPIRSAEPSSPPVKANGAIAGRCRLFSDGASRGNPGHAGAGAVLMAADGSELSAKAVYLGTCTNNLAEYQALLIGLDEALHLGCTELDIALDSELIVRQIKGQYKVKNAGLLELFGQVRERLARFRSWSIRHVPRAENARADQLANQGIDRRRQGS